jgi:hypothetical protein
VAGTFEIAVRAFADRAMENADQVVRKVVLDVWGALILRSPVDTGRFRQNWFYGADAPPRQTIPGTGTSESPAPAPQFPGVTGEALGRIHYISNNLPYARRLEFGWSKQAPQGIAGLTAVEFNDFIQKALGEVRS